MVSNILNVNVSEYRKANFNLKVSYTNSDKLGSDIIYNNTTDIADFDISSIDTANSIVQTLNISTDSNNAISVVHDYDNNMYIEKEVINDNSNITTISKHFINDLLVKSNAHMIDSITGSYTNITKENDIEIIEIGDSDAHTVHIRNFESGMLKTKVSKSILNNIQIISEFDMENNSSEEFHKYIDEYDEYDFVSTLKEQPFDLKKGCTFQYDFDNLIEFSTCTYFDTNIIDTFEKNIYTTSLDSDGFMYPNSYLSHPSTIRKHDRKTISNNISIYVSSNYVTNTIDICHKYVNSMDIYRFPSTYNTLPLLYEKNVVVSDNIETSDEVFYDHKTKKNTQKNVSNYDELGFVSTYLPVPNDLKNITTKMLYNNIEITTTCNITLHEIHIEHNKINDFDEYLLPISFQMLPLLYSKDVIVSDTEDVIEKFYETKTITEIKNQIDEYTEYGFSKHSSELVRTTYDVVDNIEIITVSNSIDNFTSRSLKYIDIFDEYGFRFNYANPENKLFEKQVSIDNVISAEYKIDYDEKIKITTHYHHFDVLYRKHTIVRSNIEYMSESNFTSNNTNTILYSVNTIDLFDNEGFASNYSHTNFKKEFVSSNLSGYVITRDFETKYMATTDYVYDTLSIPTTKLLDSIYISQMITTSISNNHEIQTLYLPKNDFNSFFYIEHSNKIIDTFDDNGFVSSTLYPLQSLVQIYTYYPGNITQTNHIIDGLTLSNVEVMNEYFYESNLFVSTYKRISNINHESILPLNIYSAFPNDIIFEKHVAVDHLLNTEITNIKNFQHKSISKVVKNYKLLHSDIYNSNYGFVETYSNTPYDIHRTYHTQIDTELLQEKITESNYENNNVDVYLNKIITLDDYGFVVNYAENRLLQHQTKRTDRSSNIQIRIDTDLTNKSIKESHKQILEYDLYGFVSLIGSNIYEKEIYIESNHNEHSIEVLSRNESNVKIIIDKSITEYTDDGFAAAYSDKQYIITQISYSKNGNEYSQEDVYSYNSNNEEIYFLQSIIQNDQVQTIERTTEKSGVITSIQQNFDGTSIVTKTDENYQSIRELDYNGSLISEIENIINNDNTLLSINKISTDHETLTLFDTDTDPYTVLSKITKIIQNKITTENYYDPNNNLTFTKEINPNTLIYPYFENIIYTDPIDDVKEVRLEHISVSELSIVKYNTSGNIIHKTVSEIRNSDGKTQDTVQIYGDIDVLAGTGELIEHLACTSTKDDFHKYNHKWYEFSLDFYLSSTDTEENALIQCANNTECKYVSKIPNDWQSSTWMYGVKYVLLSDYRMILDNDSIWENSNQFVIYNKLCTDLRTEREWNIIDNFQSDWYYSDLVSNIIYDDDGGLSSLIETNGDQTTERYYEDDNLTHVVVIVPNTINRYPYIKRTVYNTTHVIHDIKIKFQEFKSFDIQITKLYNSNGNEIRNQYDSDSLIIYQVEIINELSQIEKYYTNNIHDYSITTTRQSDNDYPYMETYIYQPHGIVDDVKTRTIEHISRTTNITEEFNNDNVQLKRIETYSYKVKEYFYSDGVKEYNVQYLYLANNSYYEITTYEDNFVVNGVRVVQKLLSEDNTVLEEYHFSSNSVKIYEKTISIDESVEIIYNAAQIKQKEIVIRPNNDTFPYQQITNFYNENILFGIKTEVITYNSVSDHTTETFNMLGNRLHNVYDGTNIIEQREIDGFNTIIRTYENNIETSMNIIYRESDNFYPYIEYVVFEYDKIIDDVKTMKQTFLSENIIQIETVNSKGNVIENIYDNFNLLRTQKEIITNTKTNKVTTFEYVDTERQIDNTYRLFPYDNSNTFTEIYIYEDSYIQNMIKRKSITTTDLYENIKLIEHFDIDNNIIYTNDIDGLSSFESFYESFENKYERLLEPNNGSFPHTETLIYYGTLIQDYVKKTINHVISPLEQTTISYNDILNVIENVYDDDHNLIINKEFNNISTTIEKHFGWINFNSYLEHTDVIYPNNNSNTFKKTIIFENDYIVDDVKTITIQNVNLENNIIDIKHQNISQLLLYTKNVNGITDIETYYANALVEKIVNTEPNTRVEPYTEVIEYFGVFIIDFVKYRYISYESSGIIQTTLYNTNMIEVENEYDDTRHLIVHRKIIGETSTENHYNDSEIIYFVRTIIPNNNSLHFIFYDVFKNFAIIDDVKERRTHYVDGVVNIVMHFNTHGTKFYQLDTNGLIDVEEYFLEYFIKTTEPNTRSFEYTETYSYYDSAITDSIKTMVLLYKSDDIQQYEFYDVFAFLIYDQTVYKSSQIALKTFYKEDGSVWYRQTVDPNTLILPYVIETIYEDNYIINKVKRIYEIFNIDNTVSTERYTIENSLINNVYDENDPSILIYSIVYNGDTKTETYYDSVINFTIVTTNNLGVVPYVVTTIYTEGIIMDNVKRIERYHNTETETVIIKYNETDNVIENIYDSSDDTLLIEQIEYDQANSRTFIRSFTSDGLIRTLTIDPNTNQNVYNEVIVFTDLGMEDNIRRIEKDYLNALDNVIHTKHFDSSGNLSYTKITTGILDKEYFYNNGTFELDYIMETNPNTKILPFVTSLTYFSDLVVDNVKRIERYHNTATETVIIKYNEIDNVIENIYDSSDDTLLIEQIEYDQANSRTFIRSFTSDGLIRTLTIDPNTNQNVYNEVIVFTDLGMEDNIRRIEKDYLNALDNVIHTKHFDSSGNLSYTKITTGILDKEYFYNNGTFELDYIMETNPNTKILPFVTSLTYFSDLVVDNVKRIERYHNTATETVIIKYNEIDNVIENIYDSSDDTLLIEQIEYDQANTRSIIRSMQNGILYSTTTIEPNNNNITYNKVILYENSLSIDDVLLIVKTVKRREFEYIEDTTQYSERYYSDDTDSAMIYKKIVSNGVDYEEYYDGTGNLAQTKTTDPNTKEYPYEEQIEYNGIYIINSIKFRKTTYVSNTIVNEVAYNSLNNIVEYVYDGDGSIIISKEYFEESLLETYYIDGKIHYTKLKTPVADSEDYIEMYSYGIDYVIDEIYYLDKEYISGSLYKIVHLDINYFEMYMKTHNTDGSISETYRTTSEDYFIMNTKLNTITYNYYGNLILDGIHKRITTQISETHIDERTYDDNGILGYKIETNADIIIESYYNESNLEFTKQTNPKTKIIPYEEIYIYYNNIVNNIIKKQINYISTDITRTLNYLAGNILKTSLDVNASTQTSIERIYDNSIEQYNITTIPINVESEYTTTQVYVESYSDSRFARNVKTVTTLYIDTLSNIDRLLYDINNTLIYVLKIRNTITTEEYYDEYNNLMFLSITSPNTEVYPYTTTIVYESDYIIHSVKQQVKVVLSESSVNTTKYNQDNNVIENEYDGNDMLILQTEFTVDSKIERYYDNNDLMYEKTIIPEDGSYPNVETLIYTDNFIEDDVKKRIVTQNSATDITIELYNNADNVIENTYDNNDPPNLIEQTEYSGLTTICKYYDLNGIVLYNKTTNPNDGSFPYIETIEYSETQSYDSLKIITITYNTSTTYVTEKRNDEDLLYEQITTVIDGVQRQDTTNRWEYITTTQPGVVYGGQCISSSYQRLNDQILYFNGSQNLGSFTGFSAVNASCNSDSRCAHITRHPGGSSSIIYYKLSGYTSQQSYGRWGPSNKYYAFAMNKICYQDENVMTWTQVMTDVVSEWY